MKSTTFGYRNGSPPPLPPHGVPIIKPQRPDYRPPVPPHRNIGVTANIGQPINGNVEQVSPLLIFHFKTLEVSFSFPENISRGEQKLYC